MPAPTSTRSSRRRSAIARVADAINETIAKIGENMTLRRAAVLSSRKGVVAELRAQFGHRRPWPDRRPGRARIAGKADELKAFGRLVAMHVAAANPQAVDPSGLDAALIQRERGVLAAKAEGKPANVVEKIVESGLKTFYKEVCLLEQGYAIEDGKKTVAQAIKKPRARSEGRSRSRALSASRSAKASIDRKAISAARWRRSPARTRAWSGSVEAGFRQDHAPLEKSIGRRVGSSGASPAIVEDDGFRCAQPILQGLDYPRRRSRLIDGSSSSSPARP